MGAGVVNLTKYHKRTPRSKWDGALRLHAPRPPVPAFEAFCGLCGYEGVVTTWSCPECSSRVQARRAT